MSAPSLSAGSVLSEHIALTYAKVKWKYIQKNVGGDVGGRVILPGDVACLPNGFVSRVKTNGNSCRQRVQNVLVANPLFDEMKFRHHLILWCC